MQNCFVPADILLPGAVTPLDPWACIAVDQFTSQPEYWQKAEELAKGKPSTLHIVLPEAYAPKAERCLLRRFFAACGLAVRPPEKPDGRRAGEGLASTAAAPAGHQ